jgi:hypothetical protein
MARQQIFEILDAYCSSTDISVLLFTVKRENYPLLFIAMFMSHLRAQNLSVQTVTVENSNRVELQRTLLMPFLGVMGHYYLRGFHDLSQSEQKKWITFFSQYRGPHRLILFGSDDDLSALAVHQPAVCVVPVPETVLPAELIDIARYRGDARLVNNVARFVHVIGRPVEGRLVEGRLVEGRTIEKIKFETAFLLVAYAAVLSQQTMADFVGYIVPLLACDEQSLFALADAFFAKEKRFFSLLKQVDDNYSTQFWISFWTDHVARAALYCQYKTAANYEEAKLISHRLPFGFINKSWRQHQPAQLVNLHNQLYQLDCQIKEGLSENRLHTILIRFFHNF